MSGWSLRVQTDLCFKCPWGIVLTRFPKIIAFASGITIEFQSKSENSHKFHALLKFSIKNCSNMNHKFLSTDMQKNREVPYDDTLWVVVVTTSQNSKGSATTLAATSPLIWAMSIIRNAPTASAIFQSSMTQQCQIKMIKKATTLVET